MADLRELTDESARSPIMDVGSRVVSRLEQHHKRMSLRNLRSSGALEVGRHTYGIPEVFVSHPLDRVIIGSFCSIAPGVRLIPGGNHAMTGVSTFPFLMRWGLESVDTLVRRRGPIVLEDDVWLGTGVVVLSGVTIGIGSVVAAGSVVTSDVEAYSVVGGVPAREIARRVDGRTAERLRASRWWERTDEELLGLMPLLIDADPSAFLRRVEGEG